MKLVASFIILVLLVFSETARGRCRLSLSRVRRLAKQWAPLVLLAQEEKFFPSSINFFLKNMKVVDKNGKDVAQRKRLNEANMPSGEPGDYLTTKKKLECPRCVFDMFYGQNPTKTSVPVYAIYRETNKLTLDIFYWFFYPYNKGKTACVGYRFRNYCPKKCRLTAHSECYSSPNKDCPCKCAKVNACVGSERTFGNHVGDWEHVSIRFVRASQTNPFLPKQLYLAIHNVGKTFTWSQGKFRSNNEAIELREGHPVIYSALGSHGSWHKAGKFPILGPMCNGDIAYDTTSDGKEWKTWQNLRLIPFLKNSCQYRGRNSFMTFLGKWGNKEQGCQLKQFTKVCALSGGPDSLHPRHVLKKSTQLNDQPPMEFVNEPSETYIVNDEIDDRNDDLVDMENDGIETEMFEEPFDEYFDREETKQKEFREKRNIASLLLKLIPKKPSSPKLAGVWAELVKETFQRLLKYCVSAG